MQNISELTQTWATTLAPLCKSERQLSALHALREFGLPDPHLEAWAFTKTLPALSAMTPAFSLPSTALHSVPSRYELTVQDGKVLTHTLPPGCAYNEQFDNDTFLDAMDTLHSMVPESSTGTLSASGSATLFVHFTETAGTRGKITPSRLTFNLAPESKLDLIFIFDNFSEAGLTLSRVDFHLQERSEAHVAIITSKNTQRFTFQRWRAFLKRDARLHSVVLTSGAQPSRHEFEAQLLEPGAEATMQGLYLLAGKQHADITTAIHHLAPNTTSSQLFKAVVQDEGHGVYTGKVVIHPGAKGANAGQKALGLLMGKNAHFSTRPQLEVYNDDVKCGHGAAVGQLNQDEYFYLASRGISPERAKQILLEAFVGEIIKSFPGEIARSELRKAVAGVL